MTEAAGSDEGPQLDELLSQFVARAQDVMAAQNRLRGLLHANRLVIGELSQSTVLERIVQAACELVNAPYGAIGVINPGGRGLAEFIQVGIDPDQMARMGHLPEGKGLLGALIDDPRPIRLRNISDDVRSVGFPDSHPPMRGFLGVPIRVRGEIFGNLYLASLAEGEFSAEDEELVLALAATAGVAIENARLYEEAKHRQDWLEASTSMTRRVLTDPEDESLRTVGQVVADLADADLVTVILPGADPQELQVSVAVGQDADDLVGFTYPLDGSIAKIVLQSGRPQVFDDAAALQPPSAVVAVAQVVPLGPVMVVPLAGAKGILGVLVVGRRQGCRPFDAAEVDMASSFASHASVALELADGRREVQRMALFEDRARIARDLHDHVIQQLFGAGISLQGVLAGMEGGAGGELVNRVIDSIDDSIRQIRASIFQLRPHAMLGVGLRSAVLAVVAGASPSLGWEPRVEFVGAVDSVSDEQFADDVAAVVRESLSNVARHAHARHATVSVSVIGPMLEVVVEDDGMGFSDVGRSSGLTNLRKRAERRSGSFVVGHGPRGLGTRLTWQAPYLTM
jgi:signal transduction histidine kinase